MCSASGYAVGTKTTQVVSTCSVGRFPLKIRADPEAGANSKSLQSFRPATAYRRIVGRQAPSAWCMRCAFGCRCSCFLDKIPTNFSLPSFSSLCCFQPTRSTQCSGHAKVLYDYICPAARGYCKTLSLFFWMSRLRRPCAPSVTSLSLRLPVAASHVY